MAVGELGEVEKQRVNAAVAKAEDLTGLEFCVIVGARAHVSSREEAERAFEKASMHERPAVLVMVTPSSRTLEIVVADELAQRLTNQACDEAVQLMTGVFSTGDIAGGLERGVALLAERAGPRQDGKTNHEGATDLPNVVDLGE